MEATPKNAKQTRLIFERALEADTLRTDVTPHLGWFARFRFEGDIERAFARDLHRPSPRPVTVTVPAEALPVIAESLVCRSDGQAEHLADWQLTFVRKALETVAEFLPHQETLNIS